jgi:uncharacterized PurR-regulated membrane protein YhhQ (DUF165 family)
MAKMKILTAGKWLWMRTVGSALVGEGVDTIVFILEVKKIFEPR